MSRVCEGKLGLSPKLKAFHQETEEDDHSIKEKEGLARNWKPVSFSSCLAEDLLFLPFYLKSSNPIFLLFLTLAFVDHSSLISALSLAWVLLSCGVAHFFLKYVSFLLSESYFLLGHYSVLLNFPSYSLP